MNQIWILALCLSSKYKALQNNCLHSYIKSNILQIKAKIQGEKPPFFRIIWTRAQIMLCELLTVLPPIFYIYYQAISNQIKLKVCMWPISSKLMGFLLQNIFNYLSFWIYKEKKLLHFGSRFRCTLPTMVLWVEFYIYIYIFFLFWKYKEFLDNKLTNFRVGDFQKNSNKGYLNITAKYLIKHSKKLATCWNLVTP